MLVPFTSVRNYLLKVHYRFQNNYRGINDLIASHLKNQMFPLNRADAYLFHQSFRGSRCGKNNKILLKN